MNVNNIRDHLLTAPSEYSYFDTGRFGGWAGPRHWKFKPMHRQIGMAGPRATTNSNGQNSNGDEEIAAKRKRTALRNVDEIHDFLMLLEASIEEMVSNGSTSLDRIEKNMSKPRRAIQLVKKTMENWEEERVVLPKDLHYKVHASLFKEHQIPSETKYQNNVYIHLKLKLCLRCILNCVFRARTLHVYMSQTTMLAADLQTPKKLNQ